MPTASTPVQFDARVRNNRVIIDLSDFTHRERRLCQHSVATRLGRTARVTLDEQHQLICTANVTSSRRREVLVQTVLHKACKLIRETVADSRRKQAQQVRTTPHNTGARRVHRVAYLP